MIVNHLPDILRELDWTPYRLAAESGQHYRVINQLVKSEKPTVSFELLDILCRTLDRQPGQLFSYQPDAARRPRAAKKKPVKKTPAKKPSGKSAAGARKRFIRTAKKSAPKKSAGKSAARPRRPARKVK